jgi:hypothetical protein
MSQPRGVHHDLGQLFGASQMEVAEPVTAHDLFQEGGDAMPPPTPNGSYPATSPRSNTNMKRFHRRNGADEIPC